MKNNDPQFFNQIIKSIQTRHWKLYEIPKEKRPNWKCYACDQGNAKYEMIAWSEGFDEKHGEPYWIGTTCAKRISKVVGFNIEKIISK
jgi:hypothetical protein